MERSVHFHAVLPMLDPMLSWVRKQAEQAGLSKKEVKQTQLALEEVLVNVIYHAYEGKGGMVELKCQMKPREKITLIVQDYGKPFNPLEYPVQLNETLSLDQRKAGGMGIHLMKQYMDEIQYQRENSANTLFLTKYASHPIQ